MNPTPIAAYPPSVITTPESNHYNSSSSSSSSDSNDSNDSNETTSNSPTHHHDKDPVPNGDVLVVPVVEVHNKHSRRSSNKHTNNSDDEMSDFDDRTDDTTAETKSYDRLLENTGTASSTRNSNSNDNDSNLPFEPAPLSATSQQSSTTKPALTPSPVPSDNAAYLRRELQDRVQKEPELFEWIQKAALDGLWYWDLENPDHEWLSPEFKALFGYDDDEVPNTSAWWQENIFPEDKEKAIANFQEHVTNGAPYNSIVRYRHKDGSTVWVRCRGLATFNEHGKPVRMLGAHSDVTQLMQIQNELKKKEAVLDMLCTTALDGFWDWNMKTGEDFLSVRWKNALGYQEEELENTVETWKALLHPEDVDKAMAAVTRHLEEGAPYSEVLRYKRKDGSYAHMLAQGVAQKDETTGEWVRMFGTHTDVSYLEEARAARLANQAKSTFLATMSHEIRTPMNSVIGMAQVLMGTELTDEQRDCVSTLHNSGKHLLSVINDILDFSQIETGNINLSSSEFNVQACVRDVVAALQLEATTNKGIDLTFETSICAGAKFLGDPERTRQVVFNLVGNAIKFTKSGGVHVGLKTEERDGLLGALVSVRDTGCGMTAEQITRIFDDFTQASSEIRHQYGGSGLGLSISKKLVAAMGGSIEVESQIHKGSTFSVWLPGFIPQTIIPGSVPHYGKVLLYEKNIGQEGLGSAACAIEATGVDVKRVSDVVELQKEFEKTPVDAVAVVPQDSGCAAEMQDFMERNKSALLVVIGSKVVDRSLESVKERTRAVPPFPTSDEVKDAMSMQRAKKIPKVNAFSFGNLGRDLRVLLAEDNKINVKVMLCLLSRFPCKVQVACNGLEAVALAEKGSFDLILMDMIMPEMDGIDATKMIRRRDRKTRIVALTANATTDDRDSCLEAGMCDFLTKPICLDALCDTLTNISTAVANEEKRLEANLNVLCNESSSDLEMP